MNRMLSQNTPTSRDTNRDHGARENAIVNVVHPTFGRPQMIDSNTITEINNNSGKCSFDEPPTYGQSCSSRSAEEFHV